MQHCIMQATGEQRRARARAERHLLDVFDLHARAADEHRAQRHRTRAVDRIDADVLADHILAGLAGFGRADHPVRIGHAVDGDQRNVGIGDLVDDRRRRRPRHVDVAGDHRARRGGAVVERLDFDINAVLLEEALLLGDVGDHDRKNRRNARRCHVIFLPCAAAGALASNVASSIPAAAAAMVLRIMESSL